MDAAQLLGPVAAALIAGAAGLFGTWLGYRQAAHAELEKHRREINAKWAELAADALSSTDSILKGFNPDSVFLFGNQDVINGLVRQQGETWPEVRRGILRVAYGHPDERVRSAALEVQKSTSNALIAVTRVAIDLIHRGEREDIDEARSDYQKAEADLESMRSAIHRT